MGSFTFIPVWIIQDIIIYIIAVVAILYIIKREAYPATVLLEFIAFIFFYAAVYENFATLMGWYGYGRSLVMIGNVPLSVPVFEYLIIYVSLRMLQTMKIAAWCKPFIVGWFGMLADFSLDPVAIKQVFTTAEGTIGRWSWFIAPHDVHIYGEPVYNFSGWMLLCGIAAALILTGRWWFRKSGNNRLVSYVYPLLAMLISLGVLCSPLSRFLLWLEPFFRKGSFAEYIMLACFLVVPVIMLFASWKGVMRDKLVFKTDFVLFLVSIGFHASNITFALIGCYWDILWLVAIAAAVHTGVVLLIYYRGKKHAALLPQET